MTCDLRTKFVVGKHGLLCLQPEKIKIPVQCHDGEEDAMEGLADPKVNPCCFHLALPTPAPAPTSLLLPSPIALHQHAAQVAATVCRSQISMCCL